MSVVVPLFLIAPLFLVPFGLRLLAVATPGSGPPRLAMRLVLPAALLLTLSFIAEPGLIAAALSLPWLGLTGAVALAAGIRLLKDPARFRPSVRHATDAAVAFLAVGATFATIDRLGARPFDFPSEIILLTAVHFHFAGFVLPLAGALAYSRRPGRWLEIALGAVVIGIPITALGFLGIPYANWIGGMLTAVGGFGIGVATVLVARCLDPRRARVLATVAGASLLISMPMAAIYATGTLVGTSWLDLTTMARIHGGLNALGFAVPVIVAWTLHRRATTPVGGPARALDVVGFNAWPFLLGPMAFVVAGLVAVTPLPLVVRIPLGLGAILAAYLTVSAAVAILWVFEVGARSRWTWIVTAAERPSRWINVTTGFDDSTDTLRRAIPGSGHAVDVFDPTIDHEAPLLRARTRFHPRERECRPDEIEGALGHGTSDAVFLLMSAHEAASQDRQDLFSTIGRSLAVDGRLILVEHLRDLSNILAFGPGAGHFQTRETWLGAAAAAGMVATQEAQLTPFVRGFVFERAEQ